MVFVVIDVVVSEFYFVLGFDFDFILAVVGDVVVGYTGELVVLSYSDVFVFISMDYVGDDM